MNVQVNLLGKHPLRGLFEGASHVRQGVKPFDKLRVVSMVEPSVSLAHVLYPARQPSDGLKITGVERLKKGLDVPASAVQERGDAIRQLRVHTGDEFLCEMTRLCRVAAGFVALGGLGSSGVSAVESIRRRRKLSIIYSRHDVPPSHSE
jgi:hypothetical protein